jgi:hypothetical protein
MPTNLDVKTQPTKQPLWPTLESRLNHPLTDTLTALKQMEANGDILTPFAKKLMSRLQAKQDLKHTSEKESCGRGYDSSQMGE